LGVFKQLHNHLGLHALVDHLVNYDQEKANLGILKKIKKMSIAFKIINPATNDSTIYIGKSTSLDLILTNNTGSEITINSGSNPSEFQIAMPEFFTSADIDNMTLSDDLSDWSFDKRDESWNILYVAYSGSASSVWEEGTDFKITINNVSVSSSTSPVTEPIKVTFENFIENPSSVSANLTLMEEPNTGNGNASLEDVLQVFLENQGQIYVSSSGDPLENTLFLTIKNIGTDPLYNGSTSPNERPLVQVKFVYGNTTGALAPDDDQDKNAVGSAWNIVGGVDISEDSDWTVTNPDPNSIDSHPTWQFAPSETNTAVIGTGEDANISFSFADIISCTPPGNTQMTVLLSGFMKDENTAYDSAIFTLNIVKSKPPQTRGLLDLYSPTPRINISREEDEIRIYLKWSMYYVNKVILSTSLIDSEPVEILYPDSQPIAADTTFISFSGISRNTLLVVTLQAFDHHGNYLNAKQFTVFIDFTPIAPNPFIDAAGTEYPTVLIGSKWWMATNLEYDASQFAYPCAGYGMYYPENIALQDIPEGWRLPTKLDWEELIKHFAGVDLLVGGSSGLNLELGGYQDYYEMTSVNQAGCYWSQTPVTPSDAHSDYYYFRVESSGVISFPFTFYGNLLMVRYVSDLEK